VNTISVLLILYQSVCFSKVSHFAQILLSTAIKQFIANKRRILRQTVRNHYHATFFHSVPSKTTYSTNYQYALDDIRRKNPMFFRDRTREDSRESGNFHQHVRIRASANLFVSFVSICERRAHTHMRARTYPHTTSPCNYFYITVMVKVCVYRKRSPVIIRTHTRAYFIVHACARTRDYEYA